MSKVSKKIIKSILEKTFGPFHDGEITVQMSGDVVRKYIENEMLLKGLLSSNAEDYYNIIEFDKTTVIKI